MALSKRGLCWPTSNHATDPVFHFTKPGSKVSWLYNWSPSPTPDAVSLDFVPMQWNHVSVESLAARVRDSRAKAVLAFNEPELPDQANMSVDVAVNVWLDHFEPLRKQGIRCGSPGISSAPQGVMWLQSFLAQIRVAGSDVDFYALHWYGETLGQFYDYLWSTYYQLGNDKPVWITEFACTNWNPAAPMELGTVEEFCAESCKYLETLEWVERFAWFGAMRDCGTVGRGAKMLGKDGGLTGLGRGYRDGV